MVFIQSHFNKKIIFLGISPKTVLSLTYGISLLVRQYFLIIRFCWLSSGRLDLNLTPSQEWLLWFQMLMFFVVAELWSYQYEHLCLNKIQSLLVVNIFISVCSIRRIWHVTQAAFPGTDILVSIFKPRDCISFVETPVDFSYRFSIFERVAETWQRDWGTRIPDSKGHRIDID